MSNAKINLRTEKLKINLLGYCGLKRLHGAQHKVYAMVG